MSTAKGEMIAIDLSAGVIRKWKETYKWIPLFGSFLAFATAFATGANSIPVPVHSIQTQLKILFWVENYNQTFSNSIKHLNIYLNLLTP